MQKDANTSATPEIKADKKNLREARRAAALRANLRRRKGKATPKIETSEAAAKAPEKTGA